jgi:hypothetical protein
LARYIPDARLSGQVDRGPVFVPITKEFKSKLTLIL